MILKRAPYSFRRDPNVPEFSGGAHLVVMDAHCALCARGAAWIARNDTAMAFTIIPMQSSVGRALLIHYGLDPDDPASWLYVEDGLAFSSLDALIRVGRRLGGIWRALVILRAVPPRWRDGLYRLVARNRYRVFGTADMCGLPDPRVQQRLLR